MTMLSPENEVSALAHQLLSPVTAAGNYAAAMTAALEKGTLTPEKTAEGLRRILQETERARTTAVALKRLFRAEHPQLTSTDTVLLCRNVLRRFHETITFRAPDALPLVRADADLLAEALTNLLTNALTAQAASGRTDAVTLTLKALSDGVQCRITNPAADAPLALAVVNKSGKSITAGGTGLGLLLVRRILECHGAQLIFAIHDDRVTAYFQLRKITPKTVL